jgi:hypothetical protein
MVALKRNLHDKYLKRKLVVIERIGVVEKRLIERI